MRMLSHDLGAGLILADESCVNLVGFGFKGELRRGCE